MRRISITRKIGKKEGSKEGRKNSDDRKNIPPISLFSQLWSLSREHSVYRKICEHFSCVHMTGAHGHAHTRTHTSPKARGHVYVPGSRRTRHKARGKNNNPVLEKDNKWQKVQDYEVSILFFVFFVAFNRYCFTSLFFTRFRIFFYISCGFLCFLVRLLFFNVISLIFLPSLIPFRVLIVSSVSSKYLHWPTKAGQQCCRQTDKQTDRQVEQIDRQTDRQADRQTFRQAAST